MLQNDFRLPTDKCTEKLISLSMTNIYLDIFDLKKAASIVQNINRKVEQLSLINKELQSRDIVYQEYLNKIKMKKEELKNKKIQMEAKEKEIYYKFEVNLIIELIENNDSLKLKLKGLNKLQNLNQLELNSDDEISRILVHNISILREKINIKLTEAEEKEKNVEKREKIINETFLRLTEEQKEEYNKLELEYKNKFDAQNFNNALEELSQIKIKDILQKVKDSQPAKSKVKIRSSSDDVLIKKHQENGENKPFTAKIKIKEKHASNGIDNLVGKIRKTFKKKENILLHGLNISCDYKCRHIKTKSEISKRLHDDSPDVERSRNDNRSRVNLSMSDNDISLIQTSKLNRTFYLIKNKRLEQQMNISLDIDFDSVCGPHCCNKLKKNYEIQYHTAANKSEKSFERGSSVSIKKRKKLYNGFIEAKIEDEKGEINTDDDFMRETKKNLEFNKIRDNIVILLNENKKIENLSKIKPVMDNKDHISKAKNTPNKISNTIIKTKSNHTMAKNKIINENLISTREVYHNLSDSKNNISEKKIKRHTRKISMYDLKSNLNDNKNSIKKKDNDKITQHVRKKSLIESSIFSSKDPQKNLDESLKSDKKYSNENISKNKLKTITEKTLNDTKLSQDTKNDLSISLNVNDNVLTNKLNETRKSLNDSKTLNDSINKSHNDSKILNASKESKNIKNLFHTKKKSSNPTVRQVPIEKNKTSNNSTMRIPNKTRKIINEGKSSNNSSKSKERNKNLNDSKIVNNKLKILNDIKILNDSGLLKDSNNLKNSKRKLNLSLEKDLGNKIFGENGNLLNNSKPHKNKISLKSSAASLNNSKTPASKIKLININYLGPKANNININSEL